MKIAITEEELNQFIEEEPQQTIIQDKEELSKSHSLFVEFTLKERGWDKEINAQEININPYSLSFFIKSLFCSNSGAIYLGTFINFFQDLDISTIEEPNFYSTCSHAATLYILKMLEKKGIVKIVEYAPQKHEQSNNLNRSSKSKLKMYDILFYKLRDLKREDRELIEQIEKTLRVTNRQIKIRHLDDEIYMKLGFIEGIKCIFSGHVFTQFKKNLAYWKKYEGFKNDLTKVLCNLKNNKTRALK